MKTLSLSIVIALTTVLPLVAAPKKLVLIAGKVSHGPGDHEHRAGCLLFKQCLAGVPNLQVEVVTNGWPVDLGVFEGADAVAVYSDGGESNPLAQPDHVRFVDGLAKKGVGIGCIHFAVEVVKEKGGKEFQDWIGGYYEHLYSCNPMWTPDYQNLPQHPITHGVKPFGVRDEWYMHMRFRPNMEGIVPILVAKPSDAVRKGPYVYPQGPYQHIVDGSGQDEIMMWAVERADGGRGFGFTGGHYHKNWGNENFRRIVLNALVWLCKLDVPTGGVESTVTPQDLRLNLDSKK